MLCAVGRAFRALADPSDAPLTNTGGSQRGVSWCSAPRSLSPEPKLAEEGREKREGESRFCVKRGVNRVTASRSGAADFPPPGKRLHFGGARAAFNGAGACQ